MTNFNFKDEDLIEVEKKEKKELEESSKKVKDKANQKWNEIFNNAQKNESTKEKADSSKTINLEEPQVQNSIEPKVEKTKTSNLTTNFNNLTTQLKQDNAQNEKVVTNKENQSEKSNFETLQEKVKGIEDKYNVTPSKKEAFDTELNLTKKEYVEKSQEELKQEAENSLADLKNSKLDSINTNFESSLKALNEKQADLKDSAKQDKSNAESYYENAKRQAEYDALKRGLQRSSIVINNLNAFDSDKVAKLLEIDKQLTIEINDLNSQIENLNTEKEQAIADFNLEYALKVSEKIADLQKEIDERNDEITEYNNKIAQIEAEFKADASEKNNQAQSDYLDDMIKYGENKGTLETLKNDELGKLVDDYLNSLSKEEALNQLQTNPYFKELLGTNFSYYLYKTNQRTN